MKLKGTKFQLKVWAYLSKIPRGSVKTYSQVAKAIGKPLAVRAVANAIGKNPLNVNTYNFKDHDKIYSFNLNIYSSCLRDFILLD